MDTALNTPTLTTSRFCFSPFVRSTGAVYLTTFPDSAISVTMRDQTRRSSGTVGSSLRCARSERNSPRPGNADETIESFNAAWMSPDVCRTIPNSSPRLPMRSCNTVSNSASSRSRRSYSALRSSPRFSSRRRSCLAWARRLRWLFRSRRNSASRSWLICPSSEAARSTIRASSSRLCPKTVPEMDRKAAAT